MAIFSVVLIDRINVLRGDANGGNHAGGVAGVNAGQLNMLHHRRNKGVLAVGEAVGLHFDGIVQKTVDQNRSLRRNINRRRQVLAEHFFVVNHFHRPAAEHEGRSHHQRISDSLGDGQGLFQVDRHSGFRLRNTKPLHRLPEPVAVLGQVDRIVGGSQNLDPRLGQFRREVQAASVRRTGRRPPSVSLFS